MSTPEMTALTTRILQLESKIVELERKSVEIEGASVATRTVHDDAVLRQERALTAIHERLGKLDVSAEKAKPSKAARFFGGLFRVVEVIAMPLVLFGLAVSYKDSIDQAISQRTLDFSGLNAMRNLISDLYADSPVKDKVESAALTVGSYGRLSTGILLNAYNLGGAARQPAARMGLLTAANVDAVGVCGALTLAKTAAANLTTGMDKLYNDETLKLITELRGSLGCEQMKRALPDWL